MLRELHIKNYAIIDEISLSLSEGFNVITGETGAGKSMLVGALSLILGERSSLEGIRKGSTQALIEASFDPISPESFSETGLDEDFLEDEAFIFKRVINKTGSRAYLNGSMTTLAQMKTLGQQLVEVHGQQGQHRLGDLNWHRTLVDGFARLHNQAREYEKSYHLWRALKDEYEQLKTSIATSKMESEDLRSQLSEISDAALSIDEESDLLREERMLKQWEIIQSIVYGLYAQLSDEGGFLSQIDDAGLALSDLDTITEDAASELSLLEQSRIQLKELSALLRARQQQEGDQPERLESIASRLFLIQQLTRKHQRSVPELLDFKSDLEKSLIGDSEESLRLSELTLKLKKTETRLRAQAEKLSKARVASCSALKTRVQAELARLGMEKTRFEIALDRTDLRLTGIDQVEFLIALPGEVLSGLAKIASGGELSRIMLALKVVLAEVDPVPTFLFDEVDAGVGGGIAERVGRRLLALSAGHQVLCITHLPQIAALADHHYFVEKKTLGDRIVTSIRLLSRKERVEELARMLGGLHITDLSRRHAEEMISAR
ncbi:MAG: DNA repair protein RecN [Nitrospirota bacterium]|nr:DNA repair protein RecN [Nitrospirota bacterium]